MTIAIVEALPPVHAAICERIGTPKPDVIYAYGPTIYNPSGGPLSRAVIVHERVHMSQQLLAGGPDVWWARYLDDRAWRFTQELEAYRAEYRAFSEDHRDRNDRARFLAKKAADLAGPMYGRVVKYGEAMALIKARSISVTP